MAFNIHKTLRSSCSIDTRRSESRDIKCSSRAFPASHSQHYRLSLDSSKTIFFVNISNFLIFTDIYDHSIKFICDLLINNTLYKTSCIFRACQLLLECMKTKSIVNALIQDPSQNMVTLKYQYIFYAFFPGRKRCSKPCRAASYDHKICCIFNSTIHNSPFIYIMRQVSKAPFDI